MNPSHALAHSPQRGNKDHLHRSSSLLLRVAREVTWWRELAISHDWVSFSMHNEDSPMLHASVLQVDMQAVTAVTRGRVGSVGHDAGAAQCTH